MGWASAARSFFQANPSKVTGKVLHLGDSMTVSQAYGYWALNGTNFTANDSDIIAWMFANLWGDSRNGFYRAAGTAETAQNGAGWASSFVTSILSDSTLNNAQMAVFQFNVPDADPRNLSAVQSVIDAYQAAGILPIVTTIPPRDHATFDYALGKPYNGALRRFARTENLPYIDLEREILLRRPNETWIDTLIEPDDGVHLSGGVNGYGPGSDPYANGGDPVTFKTGDACLNSGYLLRTWLTVQKIRDIKVRAID
jgi:hypothetical protein